ncbi:MAG: Wadjet anti-phage system protein JetD domain-containing protein [Clostridium sp.]|uniref:Wadjet anti-phage system protein JetD domain-containing protein n=1 Tax=Clostridium sp. TaxID=1506 RepID=UPI003D6CA229
MFEEIYKNIVKKLVSYKNKTIDIEKLLSFSYDNGNQVNYIRAAQYNLFESVIEKLCIEGKLKPRGKVQKGLRIHSKFEVIDNISNKEKDNKTILEISKLNLKNLDYYFKNQEKYKKHKKYIQVLNDYYMKPQKPYLTSNELSFKLFNDEKFFENPKSKINLGLEILLNLKMKYEDFNCYKTQEPFFYHVKKSFFQKESREILIIENKDTYSTLKNKKICEAFDMIIYGEGKKIISSFDLAGEYGINFNDNIKYFGDIDSEGFLIYKLFKDKFSSYNIVIGRSLYTVLLDNFNIDALPRLRNFSSDVHFDEDLNLGEVIVNMKNSDISKYYTTEPNVLSYAIDVVNSEFEKFYSQRLIEILNSKKYIPQEAVALIDID